MPNEAPSNLWSNAEPLFTETVDYYLGTGSTSVTGGVGSGIRSSRPSSCVAGVAYWSTDQGSWNAGTNPTFYSGQGVLDKCTATNTWTNNFYVPYDYPHPLAAGNVVAASGRGSGGLHGR